MLRFRSHWFSIAVMLAWIALTAGCSSYSVPIPPVAQRDDPIAFFEFRFCRRYAGAHLDAVYSHSGRLLVPRHRDRHDLDDERGRDVDKFGEHHSAHSDHELQSERVSSDDHLQSDERLGTKCPLPGVGSVHAEFSWNSFRSDHDHHDQRGQGLACDVRRWSVIAGAADYDQPGEFCVP